MVTEIVNSLFSQTASAIPYVLRTFKTIGSVCIGCYVFYQGYLTVYRYTQKSKKDSFPDSLGENWFSEICSFWPGQCFSLKIKEKIYQAKSQYQDCLCLDSEVFGRILVLDGAIQCTEKDECSYHEMIANIALFSHSSPKDVLVVGGGDGGVVREITRHKEITRIDMCELDEMVVQISKVYLPKISEGLDDPRVRVIYDDGFAYVRDHPNQYDVIIVDSSDPVGPAETLFTEEFFKYLSTCLKENGVAVTQAENIWLHLPLINKILKRASKYFKNVDYAHINVPTYPCGSIGFACCSKGDSCKSPKRAPNTKHLQQLKYYNSGIHIGSFLLPNFFKDYLKIN